MNSDQAISRAVQVRLLRLGKTQRELAREAHINPNTLSKRTTGQITWTVKLLDTIAPHLGWRGSKDIINAADNELSLLAATEREREEQK